MLKREFPIKNIKQNHRLLILPHGKGKNMKKISKWTILIAWMVIIFIFSHQPGDVSSEQSELVVYIFNFLGLNLNSMIGDLSVFIIRKGAHFTEYFILCVLCFNVLRDEFKLIDALLLSILVVFLYACSDEFHQSFIPGRGPSFKDVLIDTSGGLVAAGFIFIFAKIRRQ
jgi:VanZ family protein